MPRREEKKGGERTDDTGVWLRTTVSHSILGVTVKDAEGWRWCSGGGRGISWPSLWPYVAYFPHASAHLWALTSFFSLHSTFRCIVYVSRADSIRRFDVPNSITVICRHEKVCRTRRGWNRLFPNDTFLQTGCASDAIWWMCWQQLWSWKLKEQHGSRAGS